MSVIKVWCIGVWGRIVVNVVRCEEVAYVCGGVGLPVIDADIVRGCEEVSGVPVVGEGEDGIRFDVLVGVWRLVGVRDVFVVSEECAVVVREGVDGGEEELLEVRVAWVWWWGCD